MSLPRITLFFLLLLPAALPAGAGGVLFEVEVEVEDRDQAARLEGFVAALDTVLVRLVGRSDAPEDMRLADLRETARRFVGSYRYLDPVTEGGGARLWVRFDGAALEEAVSERGVAIWGLDRPQVLVWLVVRDAEGRYFATDGMAPERVAALDAAARTRGLPVIMPLFDMEDRGAISPADIAVGFHERVLAASRRYAPGAVLTISLDAGPSGWEGRWSFYHGEEHFDGGWTADDEALIALAIGQAADSLARRFAAVRAVVATGDGLTVRVEGLNTIADFARAEQGLGELRPVAEVTLLGMEGGAAIFSLAVRGTAGDVERAASVGSTFSLTARKGGAEALRLTLLP